MKSYELFETPVIPDNFPWHMPIEFRKMILSWPKSNKSPYSHSYYNLANGEKDWDITPVGSLRISDHWNFKSHGKVHCPTDQPIQNNRYWALGKWDGEKYVLQEILPRRKLVDLSDEEASKLSPDTRNRRKQHLKKQQRKLEKLPS